MLIAPVSADTIYQNFSYTGNYQNYTVPAYVHQLNISASGSSGGDAFSRGGIGTTITTVLNVTPGQTLKINVGGVGYNGAGTAGRGYGKNGGGMTNISYLTTNYIIAGGGGGASGGAPGGDSGYIGSHGSNGTSGVNSGGDGGTQLSGGAGGVGFGAGGGNGVNGVIYTGGNGGIGVYVGAGGGGGYYGGGGGGGNNNGTSSGGAGGGGSSWTNPAFTFNTSYTSYDFGHSLPGYVIITYNTYIIGNVSASYSLYAGQILTINPTISGNSTPVNWSKNFTMNNGSFNTTTGALIWNTTAILDSGIHYFQIVANDSLGYGPFSFSVTVLQNLTIASPTNTTTTPSNIVNIIWNQYPNNPNYAYILCSDYYCINTISTGTGTPSGTGGNYTTGNLILAVGTTYYFNVSDASGVYVRSEFTTPAVVVTPGSLNITVKDEQNITQTIKTFYVQLYNSSAYLNKSTTTGWVNFTGSEVSAGQYLVRIVPNSSYASRSILVTSPTTATVYVPATAGNTIDLVSFFLYDYTNQFPWQTSVITVTKNSLVMHQSYFDGDTGAPVYLIQGDVYGITITNGNNVQNWGNYQAMAPANVQIALSGISVNASKYVPLSYNISEVNGSNPAITLQWSSLYGYLQSLNFTIQNGSRATVHQLITSVPSGQSVYSVTNVSDIYYIYVSALTNDGYVNGSFAYDYRYGGQLPDDGFKTHLGWGTFTLPSWITTLCVLFVVIILAGTFGAIYAPLGGFISVVFLIVSSKWGWVSNTTAAGGFLAGLTILVIFSFIKDREYDPNPSMYAYKSSMFLMYCNAGISLVNIGGLMSGAWVSTYNTHNIIFDIISKVGIFGTDQNAVVTGTSGISYAAVATGAAALLLLSLGVLALSTFGLFALTLPAMALVFGFSTLISGSYIYSLNLPVEWVFALSSGLVIVNLVGFMQYMGMSSMKLKE